jgi:hypothetical protein
VGRSHSVLIILVVVVLFKEVLFDEQDYCRHKSFVVVVNGGGSAGRIGRIFGRNVDRAEALGMVSVLPATRRQGGPRRGLFVVHLPRLQRDHANLP